MNGFNCSCAPGYTGFICETDIDDCEMNPCENDGTCLVSAFIFNEIKTGLVIVCLYSSAAFQDLVNDYRCLCPGGWAGKSCDMNIQECELLQPCHNGATCLVSIML